MSGLPGKRAWALKGPGIGRTARVLFGMLALAMGATACEDDNGPAQDEITVALAPATLNVPIGGTASTIINISTDVTDPLHLTAVGAPAGVTIAFTPEDLPAGEMRARVNVAVAAEVEPGHYDVMVKAACDHASSHDVALSVVVVNPLDGAFGINVTPGEVTAKRGGDPVSATIGLSRVAPFAGGVELAAGDLPVGLTVTFSPKIATGASAQVLVTAAADMEPGDYEVAITGSVTGMPDAVIHLAVAVPEPTFTLGFEPDTLVLVAGGPAATADIEIAREAGFDQGVDMIITTLPTGLSLSQVPPTTVTGEVATLTLQAAADMKPGYVSLKVTGYSADYLLSAAATLVIEVKEPAD